MIKAILFDRDGVIIDTEPVNVEAAVRAFRDLGIEIDEQDKSLVIARHPIDYVDVFLQKYSFPKDEFILKHDEYYHQLLGSIKFFDQMIALIKKLKTQGYLLALTTASEFDDTQMIIKQAGLANVFDVVVTFEDCDKRKPNPIPYLITAQKLKVEPAECLVIEDSSVGLEAAKRAGMKCFVIPTAYTKNQDFSQADYIAKNANDLELSLQNLVIVSN